MASLIIIGLVHKYNKKVMFHISHCSFVLFVKAFQIGFSFSLLLEFLLGAARQGDTDSEQKVECSWDTALSRAIVRIHKYLVIFHFSIFILITNSKSVK